MRVCCFCSELPTASQVHPVALKERVADPEASAPKEKAADPEASTPKKKAADPEASTLKKATDPALQLVQTSTGVLRAQEDKAAAPLDPPEASRGHVSALSFKLSSFCRVHDQRSRWE